MDPIIGGALLSGGSSLLGGIFGNRSNRREARRQEAFNRQMIAEQNAYNDPAQIRARAEAAGFNPLLFVGPGVGLQTSVATAAAAPASAMGSAIADAGMMLGQAFAGVGAQRRASAMNKLAADNARLRRDLTQQTLRPKIPGQYGPLVTRAGSGQTAAVNNGGVYVASGSQGSYVVPAGRPDGGGSNGRSGGVGAEPPAQISPVPAPKPAASDQATRVPILPFKLLGFDIYPSGDNSDTETSESRYGDGMGTVSGALAAGYDVLWNAVRTGKNWSFDPKYRRIGADGSNPGSPAARRQRHDDKINRDIAFNLGNRKRDTWGSGARVQDF